MRNVQMPACGSLECSPGWPPPCAPLSVVKSARVSTSALSALRMRRSRAQQLATDMNWMALKPLRGGVVHAQRERVCVCVRGRGREALVGRSSEGAGCWPGPRAQPQDKHGRGMGVAAALYERLRVQERQPGSAPVCEVALEAAWLGEGDGQPLDAALLDAGAVQRQHRLPTRGTGKGGGAGGGQSGRHVSEQTLQVTRRVLADCGGTREPSARKMELARQQRRRLVHSPSLSLYAPLQLAHLGR
jgi:hypothetical protein